MDYSSVRIWKIALAVFLVVVSVGMFTVVPFFQWIIGLSGIVCAVSVLFDR